MDNRELLTFQIITEQNITPKFTTTKSPMQVICSIISLTTEGCAIPKLDLFDKSIIKLIKIPEDINCTDKFSFPLDCLLNSQIKPLTAQIRKAGYKSCYYRTIHRREDKNIYLDSTFQTS